MPFGFRLTLTAKWGICWKVLSKVSKTRRRPWSGVGLGLLSGKRSAVLRLLKGNSSKFISTIKFATKDVRSIGIQRKDKVNSTLSWWWERSRQYTFYSLTSQSIKAYLGTKDLSGPKVLGNEVEAMGEGRAGQAKRRWPPLVFAPIADALPGSPRRWKATSALPNLHPNLLTERQLVGLIGQLVLLTLISYLNVALDHKTKFLRKVMYN